MSTPTRPRPRSAAPTAPRTRRPSAPSVQVPPLHWSQPIACLLSTPTPPVRSNPKKPPKQEACNGAPRARPSYKTRPLLETRLRLALVWQIKSSEIKLGYQSCSFRRLWCFLFLLHFLARTLTSGYFFSWANFLLYDSFLWCGALTSAMKHSNQRCDRGATNATCRSTDGRLAAPLVESGDGVALLRVVVVVFGDVVGVGVGVGVGRLQSGARRRPAPVGRFRRTMVLPSALDIALETLTCVGSLSVGPWTPSKACQFFHLSKPLVSLGPIKGSTAPLRGPQPQEGAMIP